MAIGLHTLGSLEIVGRLLIASLAGSVIGLERERLQWAAGLRTHMLVCVGSCLVIIVSAYGFNDVIGPGVVLDPSRVAAQVVSGIGFLGAGTILLRGEIVKGLTTAASLWAVAAIGLAIGGGLYVPGLTTTVIVVVILAGLKPLEERVRERSQTRQMLISAQRDFLTLASLHDIIGPRAARVKQFIQQRGGENEPDEIQVVFTRLTPLAIDDVAQQLRARSEVISVKTDASA